MGTRTIQIDERIHKILKKHAVEVDVSLYELILHILIGWIKNHLPEEFEKVKKEIEKMQGGE